MAFQVPPDEYARWVREGLVPGTAPRPDPVLAPASEKEFQSAVVKLAKDEGWRLYHTWNSRRSESGFPDLVLIRGDLLVAAELKVGDNRLTAAQSNWLDAFRDVRRVEARVWRPEGWAEIVRMLGR